MPFLRQVIVSVVLVTLTLSFQSAGMAGFVVWVRAYFARNTSRLGLVRCAWVMVRVAHSIFLLQVLEVALWAGFFRWKCFPSWESALYFSTTSYSTVGYGDLLLPSTWRLLGPIESITGVLMCGVSVSVLFAIVLLLIRHEDSFLATLQQPSKPGASPRDPFVGGQETEPAAETSETGRPRGRPK